MTDIKNMSFEVFWENFVANDNSELVDTSNALDFKDARDRLMFFSLIVGCMYGYMMYCTQSRLPINEKSFSEWRIRAGVVDKGSDEILYTIRSMSELMWKIFREDKNNNYLRNALLLSEMEPNPDQFDQKRIALMMKIRNEMDLMLTDVKKKAMEIK